MLVSLKKGIILEINSANTTQHFYTRVVCLQGYIILAISIQTLHTKHAVFVNHHAITYKSIEIVYIHLHSPAIT